MVGFSGLDSVRTKRDQPPLRRRRRCPRRVAKPRTLTCAHMYLSRRVSESGSVCTYGGKGGGAEGDRMYLRDREPARTLPVICGPYQMRPKSFHHSLAPRRAYSAFSPFARSLALSLFHSLSFSPVRSFLPRLLSSILPGLPASLRFAQKSLRSTLLLLQLRRSSRIMYQPADLFSIATLTPSTRGKSSYGYVRYGRADPEVRHER